MTTTRINITLEFPSADQVEALIKILESGHYLDAGQRASALAALLPSALLAHWKIRKTGGGRPIAIATIQAAALANELIDIHGARRVRIANKAAFESARRYLGANNKLTLCAIERASSKLRNLPTPIREITWGKTTISLPAIPKEWVDDARKRLTRLR